MIYFEKTQSVHIGTNTTSSDPALCNRLFELPQATRFLFARRVYHIPIYLLWLSKRAVRDEQNDILLIQVSSYNFQPLNVHKKLSA